MAAAPPLAPAVCQGARSRADDLARPLLHRPRKPHVAATLLAHLPRGCAACSRCGARGTRGTPHTSPAPRCTCQLCSSARVPARVVVAARLASPQAATSCSRCAGPPSSAASGQRTAPAPRTACVRPRRAHARTLTLRTTSLTGPPLGRARSFALRRALGLSQVRRRALRLLHHEVGRVAHRDPRVRSQDWHARPRRRRRQRA